MNKKDLKSLQTKQKLQKAFLQLYAETDIEKISVKAITDIVGCNRATFYTHYTDVYQLRQTIEENLLNNFEDNADKILASMGNYNIMPLIAMLTSLYRDYGDTLPILLTHKNYNFANAVKDLIRNKFLKICPDLTPEDQIRVSLIIEYQQSAVIGAMSYWRKTKGMSFDELLKSVREISTNGVMSSIGDVIEKYIKHLS